MTKCKQHNFEIQKTLSNTIMEICTRCGLQVEYVPKQSNPIAQEGAGSEPLSDTIEVSLCLRCRQQVRWPIGFKEGSIQCPHCDYTMEYSIHYKSPVAEGGPAKENVLFGRENGPEVLVKTFDSGAVRVDENTPAYSYIPPCAIRRLAYIYKEGEQHYPGFNWRKGIPVSNIVDHALEHLFKWLEGNRSEDHLAKVAWAMFSLVYYEEEGILKDDIKWTHKKDSGIK